jgi:hypothetical protein
LCRESFGHRSRPGVIQAGSPGASLVYNISNDHDGIVCIPSDGPQPHPTIKTNRPALARSATSDLPMFVTT